MSATTRSGSLAWIFTGFFVLWLILDRTAAASGSLRGEWGILICGMVLAAAIAIERVVSATNLHAAEADLGLRLASRRSLTVALGLGLLLLAFFPIYSAATGTPITVRPDWYWLVPGLFAQGGIAEETVFRGFLFRHLRTGRSFWRAAVLAAIPFTAVHLLLFLTLDFAIALASVVVAVSLSFPLAWLFERAGNSVWPSAIVHFVVQAPIKLVEAPENAFQSMAIVWMALSILLPWAVFALLPRPSKA